MSKKYYLKNKQKKFSIVDKNAMGYIIELVSSIAIDERRL